MGRRKARKPAPKRKPITPLDTLFNCPFCNHEQSCKVEMLRPMKIGTVSCTVCSETYETAIHYLSAPVDVYNDWIDACESAN